MKIIHWSEPSLLFSRGQIDRIIDPKEGLSRNGPYDYNFSIRTFDNIYVKVVCTEHVKNKISKLIKRLKTQHPIKSTWRTIKYPYPGFEQTYKIKLAEPTDNDYIFIDPSYLNSLLSTRTMDSFIKKFNEIYNQKLQDIVDMGYDSNTVVYVYIPESLQNKFVSLKGTLDIRGIDLRTLIKAMGVKARVKTQIITEKALEPDDLADTLWNLSLATYVKAGGRPWIIREIPASSVFIGIRHGIRKDEKGQVIAIGLAEIFNTYGEFVDMAAVDFKPEDQLMPNLWNKNPYLTEKGMKKLISKAIEAYKKSIGDDEKPYSVTIHRTLNFTGEEIKGALSALSGTQDVNMLYIMEDPNLRLLDENIVTMRGTFLRKSDREGLLYTTGYSEAEGTYPGIGTPKPLELYRCYGERSIEELAMQVFSLTKMDWNTTRVMLREPVTIKYAKRVASIVKLGIGDFLIRDIRYYF